MDTMTEGAVLTCTVMDCEYNIERRCEAPDITIGDEHPTCDTYERGPHHAVQQMAQVGVCHLKECDFNDSESCTASGITVGMHEAHADCYTYRG